MKCFLYKVIRHNNFSSKFGNHTSAMGGVIWSGLAATSLIRADGKQFQAKHAREKRSSTIHDWIEKANDTKSLVTFLQTPRGSENYTILPTKKKGIKLLLVEKQGTKGDVFNENLSFKVDKKKE